MEKKLSPLRRLPIGLRLFAVGSVLLALVAGLALVPQFLAKHNSARADGGNAHGIGTVTLDPNSGTIQWHVDVVYDGHANTPMMFHIHDGSCTGPVVDGQSGGTDAIGHAAADKTFNQQISSLPTTWWVNVHDMNMPLPNGKYQSVGCGALNVIGGLAGTANIA